MRVLGREIEVLASPFGVEPIFRSDRLQQSGFSRPILPDEKGDGRMKLQAVEMPHCRNAKRIFITIDARFLFQADRLQKRLLDNRRHSLSPVIGCVRLLQQRSHIARSMQYAVNLQWLAACVVDNEVSAAHSEEAHGACLSGLGGNGQDQASPPIARKHSGFQLRHHQPQIDCLTR